MLLLLVAVSLSVWIVYCIVSVVSVDVFVSHVLVRLSLLRLSLSLSLELSLKKERVFSGRILLNIEGLMDMALSWLMRLMGMARPRRWFIMLWRLIMLRSPAAFIPSDEFNDTAGRVSNTGRGSRGRVRIRDKRARSVFWSRCLAD